MNVPRSTDSALSAPSVGNNKDGQVADNWRLGMSGEEQIPGVRSVHPGGDYEERLHSHRVTTGYNK